MGETTRPPRKEDLVKLCEELNRLDAKYVVIGGLAMNNLGLVHRLISRRHTVGFKRVWMQGASEAHIRCDT
jgi:hypothetical protein